MSHPCLNTTKTSAFVVCIQDIPAAALILQHKNSSKNTTSSVFCFNWNSFKMEQERRHNFSLPSGRKKEQQQIVRTSKRGYCGLVLQGNTGMSPLGVKQSTSWTLAHGRDFINQCAFSQNEKKQSSIQKDYFPVNVQNKFNCIWGIFFSSKWHEPLENIPGYSQLWQSWLGYHCLGEIMM